ncbi:MAG: ABC transporter permease [Clostridia bacterium]|nr:ABC transporter permease [Clostridia bacterium]
MLKFVFRKMLNKKWMILSLLIGNIFLISIAMSGPMYIDAVTQNLLTRTLTDSYRETGEFPALYTMEASMPKGKKDSVGYTEYMQAKEDMAALPAMLGTQAMYETELTWTEDYSGKPTSNREDGSASLNLFLSTMTGLEDHMELVAGELTSSEPDAEGAYNVLVSRTAFIRKRLLLGEVLEYQYLTAPDGNPLRLRIAGVFDSTDDAWWTQHESYYAGHIFMDKALFDQIFMSAETNVASISSMWITHIDYEAMRSETAQQAVDAIDAMNKKYNLIYIKNFKTSCETMLKDYITEAAQAAATLKVLQVPIFALLIAFIFMVSRQILEIEQSEIAVLKSRGASGRQVLSVYLTQGLLLAVTGFAISIPTSGFLCSAIGSASAFLEFSNPAALTIVYDLEAFIYAIAAAALCVITMVGPAISFSRLTIVDAKRSKHAGDVKPFWQKFFLDFLVLAVAVYSLYSFGNQKEMLAERVSQGAALDPLLYISSSLFAVGASLVAVRFIPVIASGVFRLFAKLWRPAMYASFLQILRSRHHQTFMMCFVMLTIAIGMYNADTASTVNTAQEEQLRFDLGADVVLQESWQKSGSEYIEPDIARYERLDGVESVTKVFLDGKSSAEARTKLVQRVQLMGIETHTFGKTAWMKDGLSEEHFFTYLNDMSQVLNGALVSRNFETILGLEVGDTINVRPSNNESVNLTITGFVDHFPSYTPTVREFQDDGTEKTMDRYLVVANFGYLKSVWGNQPYEIWIKSPESADSVNAYAAESGMRYHKYSDIYSRIDAMKNSPSIQGTNGILTLSFIIGLILCAAGFLIFWILSIQSRSLQFGIYRAMGMSVGELIMMLINEHFWQSVTSVAAGAGIGFLVSKLYIPLIQIAYSTANASLPLEVTRNLTEHIRLIVIIMAVLVVCISILIALVRKLKIAQAIKLGED